ncbi:hypothetical protein [Neolewinella antarctica]|uniref:Uncharacterized protein n=1 Tax=Neolewinella antarctica TaxID=442734 RepID=A0ABX0XH70_9BACT|nr:hypothetical protein [Neolewinella antarctica]NJC28213.1 hypothetical protein [Neolewinella antarctica]
MQRDARIIRHPGLKPLWNSLERERRQQQIVSVVLMVVGLSTAVVGVVVRSAVWPVVGGFLASFALWWLYRILSDQPLAYLHRQLRDEPETIAWVYSTQTERMPFGFKTQSMGTLYLVEPDGTTQSYSLKPGKLRLVVKTLNRVLPHADFGYTEARDMKYRGEVTRVRGGRREQDIGF